MKVTPKLSLVFLAFPVLAGMPLLLWATARWGIGLAPDSIGYLVAARSLLSGQGMLDIPGSAGELVAFTRHGPVITWLIALAAWVFRLPVDTAAQWVHSVLFSGNIFIASYAALRYTSSRVSAALAGFLVLLSPVMWEIHSTVLSEPVFILLGMLGLYLLTLALGKGSSHANLLPAACCLSVSVLSRYAGVSLIAAAGLCILLWGRGSWTSRLAQAVQTGILSASLLAAWIYRNHQLSQGPGFPGAMFEPYFLTSFWELGAYFSIWIVPVAVNPLLRGLILGFFLLWAGAAYAAAAKADFGKEGALKKSTHVLRYFPWVLSVFIFCHLSVHILSATFLDRDDMNNRHLSPVYMALILLFVILGWRIRFSSTVSGWIKRAGFFAAVFFCLSYSLRSGVEIAGYREKGIGYAAPQWIHSELLEQVRKLPQEIPVYTNGIDILYWFANRPVRPIPDKLWQEALGKPGPARLNPRRLELMVQEMRENGAVIAYFRNIYWRWYYPSFEEIQANVPLQVLAKTQDGELAGFLESGKTA